MELCSNLLEAFEANKDIVVRSAGGAETWPYLYDLKTKPQPMG